MGMKNVRCAENIFRQQLVSNMHGKVKCKFHLQAQKVLFNED